jgi:hypothetical protein
MVTQSLFLGEETRKFILLTLERDVSEEKLLKIYGALKQIHEKENSMLAKAIKKDPNLLANINGTLSSVRRRSILKKEAIAKEDVDSLVLDDLEDEMGIEKSATKKKKGFLSRLFGGK